MHACNAMQCSAVLTPPSPPHACVEATHSRVILLLLPAAHLAGTHVEVGAAIGATAGSDGHGLGGGGTTGVCVCVCVCVRACACARACECMLSQRHAMCMHVPHMVFLHGYQALRLDVLASRCHVVSIIPTVPCVCLAFQCSWPTSHLAQ